MEITNLRVEREREGEQEHRKMQCQRDAAGEKKKHTAHGFTELNREPSAVHT